MDTRDPRAWTDLFFISNWLIRLAMLAIVPYRRSPAAAKAWLLLILFLPWPGFLLYLVLGRALPRWRREQFDELPSVLAEELERLRRHPHLARPAVSEDLLPAVQLAHSLGQIPCMGGNSAELLSDYEGTIDRIVADIDAARHHVHLLFYIYVDDDTTRRVTLALERAVQRGVACRVLVDSFGSKAAFRALVPRLEGAGVQVHGLLPVALWRMLFSRPDLRNHRKIVVIDGRVGYTGSQNLMSPTYKEGITYEEMMVRVTGPVVLALQYVFVADWYLETDLVLRDPDILPDPEQTGSIAAQALPSGPNFDRANNQRLFVALIHAARQRVVITTPYFIPDEPILQAMETAVLRGVEVHLVVSELADQFLVSRAQQSYYEELLEMGVQIHLYRGKFLHAKHMSIDDEIAVIGSSNMDIRSFTLLAEITLIFYDRELALRLREDQVRYFENSSDIVYEELLDRPFVARWLDDVIRLMSPLL